MDFTHTANNSEMIENHVDVPTWAWWSHFATALLFFLSGRFFVGRRINRFMLMVDKVQRHNVLVEADRDKYKALSESQNKLLIEYKKQLAVSLKAQTNAEENAKTLQKLYNEQKQYVMDLYLALVKGGSDVPRPAWMKESNKK